MTPLDVSKTLTTDKRWSRFVRQAVKVDSPMKRMIHHEDAETVFV
jgi:hypothetical protein